MTGSQHALAAWILSKGIALCALISFLSALVQIHGLIGSKGILPASRFLEFAAMQMGPARFTQVPTLFWFSSTDTALAIVLLLGIFAATAALLGVAAPLMFGVCFVCSLSLLNVGQDFFAFQWDVLLLECLFLAIFLGPWPLTFSPWIAQEPNTVVKWLFWILLFKLMFLSGVVKLASLDPSWKNLTALKFHYETQPLPNPLSWYAHQLPDSIQKLSCAIMFFIELVLPFALLIPIASFRIMAALGFILLQILILATGNYTFFNLLTIVLSLFLIPDEVWSQWPALHALVRTIPETSGVFGIGLIVVAIPLVLMHLFWLFRPFGIPEPLNAVAMPIVRLFNPFHINNSYGLFAVMTTTRPEIDIQGSNDGVTWLSYEFKNKPGSLGRRPPQVAPHQPRLDWQMWFAALGTYEDSSWLPNLMARLLQGERSVLSLLKSDPFPGQPPLYVRAMVSDYQFTTKEERSKTGQWWKTGSARPYSPVLKRRP